MFCDRHRASLHRMYALGGAAPVRPLGRLHSCLGFSCKGFECCIPSPEKLVGTESTGATRCRGESSDVAERRCPHVQTGDVFLIEGH